MTNNKTHTVFIEKVFDTNIETLFNLFKDGSIFKLTGADDIQSDFESNGHFCLTFNGRGTIHGHFIKITRSSLVLEWNVEGFQRPEEINTVLEISFRKKNNQCILKLQTYKYYSRRSSCSQTKSLDRNTGCT